MTRTRHLRLLPKGRQPTEREVEVLLALIRYATWAKTSKALGVTVGALRAVEASLFAKIGARNRPHAAALLYPVLHDRYVLPGDERRHHARRAS